MSNIDPDLLLVLVGCAYILAFGALSFMRREGLSIQFAVEAIAVTAALVGVGYLLGRPPSPLVLLILLYLVTMRSRLLVDLANVFARRDRYSPAFSLYGLALALWPDASARLTVLANRGAAELHSGRADAAVQTIESVLDEKNRPRLGLRYEAVCRYNLGLAYQTQGGEDLAVEQFNQVIELLPGSPAAQAARAALKRRKSPPAESGSPT